MKEILRFSLVYIILFLLLICGSNGVFGQTMSSNVSPESFDKNAFQSNGIVFGKYSFDAGSFKGDIQKTSTEIENLVKARQEYIDKIKLQEHADLNRLKEEHKALMWNSGNQGYDEADKTNKEFTKWSVAMYANISQQATLKQTTQGKIAAWDSKNFLKIKSVEKDGKKVIASIEVTREKTGKDKSMASLP